MARQKIQDLKVLGSNPGLGKKKIFSLVFGGCFGTYEIYLLVFAVLLKIHVIIKSDINREEGSLFSYDICKSCS